jgi:hypothetical protein
MPEYISINNKIFTAGQKFVANKYAESNSYCNTGLVVSLECIKMDGGENLIGISSEKPVPHWHDLEGRVSDKYGYWVRSKPFLQCFNIVGVQKMVVKGDVLHKQINLNGKKCKVLKNIIAPNGNKYSFVEMEENVNGGSADGLGKHGHCIILSTNSLCVLPEDKKMEG